MDYKLSEKTKEILDKKTKYLLDGAKGQAQKIIDDLEPEHVSSFADLYLKLDTAKNNAKKMEEFLKLEIP